MCHIALAVGFVGHGKPVIAVPGQPVAHVPGRSGTGISCRDQHHRTVILGQSKGIGRSAKALPIVYGKIFDRVLHLGDWRGRTFSAHSGELLRLQQRCGSWLMHGGASQNRKEIF